MEMSGEPLSSRALFPEIKIPKAIDMKTREGL
jgi:hypothetical protein